MLALSFDVSRSAVTIECDAIRNWPGWRTRRTSTLSIFRLHGPASPLLPSTPRQGEAEDEIITLSVSEWRLTPLGSGSALIAFVEHEEVEAQAILDPYSSVVGNAVPGVANASRVADRDEAVDHLLTVVMGAESVVATLDRGDVFVADFATLAVDVEAVVMDVRGGHVADQQVRAISGDHHAAGSDGRGNVVVGQRFGRIDPQVESVLALHDGPLAGLQFVGLFERLAGALGSAPPSAVQSGHRIERTSVR